MQIAKLFASLGFQIDTADLSRFEVILKNVQGDMSALASSTQRANTKLRILESRFKKASDALNSSTVAKATDVVAKAVNKYTKNVKEIVDIDPKLEKVFKETEVRITNLSNKLDNGTAAWNRYEQQVKEATTRMKEFSAAARERQSINPPRGTGAGSGSNQGGGGNAGGRGNNGVNDPSSGTTVLAGARQFGKAFVGQLAFGGLLGSGYIVKEIIQSGREVQKMEQMLLQASKSAQDFSNNLQFTKETSNALAVDFTEFGVAYSKILNATERSILTQKQKQDIVFGFAKYMRTINLASPDQAGVFRQLGQMFNTGRIQQDEINSMSDRGIAMNKFLRMAAEKLGMSGQQYQKLQESGKADPIKLLPIVAKMLADAAENNGAFAKSLSTSLAKQQAFTNAMKQFAATILKSGVDKGLANLFTGLEKIVLILTPFVAGLIAVIGGIFNLFALLLSFDWWVYAGIVAAALAIIVAGFYSIGGAALVAEVAAYSLAAAMRVLSVAFPIAGLITLIGLLGVYKNQQDRLQNGEESSTWIDLWVLRLQFFFMLMRLGWVNTKIAVAETAQRIKELFTTDPPDWFKKYIQGQTLAPQTSAFNSGMGEMKNLTDTKNNQNLSIPVDVYLTIQNPDGSTYQARASKTPIINVGALGLAAG